MGETDNRAIVERFVEALASGDRHGYEATIDEDSVLVYPQSGERFRGRRNLMGLQDAFRAQYGGFRPTIERVIGEEPTWGISPTYTVVRIDGSGEHFTAAGRVRYPDGTEWHLVQLIEVRAGRVTQVTSYFAEPFEAPDWRAPYREPSTP